MDGHLPCQEEFLRSRTDHPISQDIIRLYRCEAAGELCAIVGVGSDCEILLLACEECKRRPVDLELNQTDGPFSIP